MFYEHGGGRQGGSAGEWRSEAVGRRGGGGEARWLGGEGIAVDLKAQWAALCVRDARVLRIQVNGPSNDITT